MIAPIQLTDGLTWHGPTEPGQLFHGSRCKGLPIGEILLPQARGGVMGWIQDPTTDHRNYLYVSPCSAVSTIYSIGRGFNSYIGGVYRVAVDQGDLLESDTESPEFQFRCIRARVVADVTNSLFPWREFVEPAMHEKLLRMQREGAAPALFNGKATLADLQSLSKSTSAGAEVGAACARLMQRLARNFGEMATQ